MMLSIAKSKEVLLLAILFIITAVISLSIVLVTEVSRGELNEVLATVNVGLNEAREAKAVAQEAKSTAEGAQRAADNAQACCNDGADKLDRMFEGRVMRRE